MIMLRTVFPFETRKMANQRVHHCWPTRDPASFSFPLDSKRTFPSVKMTKVNLRVFDLEIFNIYEIDIAPENRIAPRVNDIGYGLSNAATISSKQLRNTGRNRVLLPATLSLMGPLCCISQGLYQHKHCGFCRQISAGNPIK